MEWIQSCYCSYQCFSVFSHEQHESHARLPFFLGLTSLLQCHKAGKASFYFLSIHSSEAFLTGVTNSDFSAHVFPITVVLYLELFWETLKPRICLGILLVWLWPRIKFPLSGKYEWYMGRLINSKSKYCWLHLDNAGLQIKEEGHFMGKHVKDKLRQKS